MSAEESRVLNTIRIGYDVSKAQKLLTKNIFSVFLLHDRSHDNIYKVVVDGPWPSYLEW